MIGITSFAKQREDNRDPIHGVVVMHRNVWLSESYCAPELWHPNRDVNDQTCCFQRETGDNSRREFFSV